MEGTIEMPEETRLTPRLAEKLAAIFDLPATWWVDLQKRHDGAR